MKQIVLLLAFLLSVSCHRRPLEDPANNTTLRVAVNIKAKKLRRKRTSPTSRMTMKEHVACKAISAYAREPTRC